MIIFVLILGRPRKEPDIVVSKKLKQLIKEYQDTDKRKSTLVALEEMITYAHRMMCIDPGKTMELRLREFPVQTHMQVEAFRRICEIRTGARPTVVQAFREMIWHGYRELCVKKIKIDE